jgi:integrase
MATSSKRLTDTEIKTAKVPAGNKNPIYLRDPGNPGLYVRVTPNGTKTFLYRYFQKAGGEDGKDAQRWLSLGTYPEIGIARARELAQEQRNLRRQKLDPKAEQQRRADEVKAADGRAKVEAALAETRTKTFQQCALAYYEAHKGEWDNPAFRESWLRSLEIHAFPVIGEMPVADVTKQDVRRVLAPIWSTKTKTAKDLRGRIAKVLGWAANEGYRADGPNPAAWESNLEFALAKPSKIRKVERHKPVPVADIVAFMAKLQTIDTMTARMLEFAILNASRAGEVRFARWSEIDMAKRTWTIPAIRMKTRHHDWAADHVVPLSDAAMSILQAIGGDQNPEPQDYVFAGWAGLPLAETGMRHLVWKLTNDRTFTVHGFRGTFTNWAGDETNADEETREFCLAHVKRGVAGHYRSTTAIMKRRVLLQAWAIYCSTGIIPDHLKPPQSADVISISTRQAA